MKGTKVYILDLGYMLADINCIVPGTNVASASEPERKNQLAHSTCDAILIDHPTAGKILFDLGCHPDAMKGRWPSNMMESAAYYYTPEQTLDHQLALCGTKAEDISMVALSHMHLDHAGYLFRFPHTKMIVHAAELPFAMGTVYQRLSMEGQPSYVRADLVEPVDEYTLVEGDTEIADGVTLLELPGHTPGHMGLMVETDSGTLIFCRDACVHHALYGPPAKPSGFVADWPNYKGSIEKVRRLAKEHNAMVVFGHDWEQFCSMKHAPEYY